MTKLFKKFEQGKLVRRGLLGISMAIGSLGLASVTKQGVAQASGPDMSYLVEQDGTGIINLFEHNLENPLIAKDTYVNDVNHIQVTLASKFGRYVLSETVPFLNNVNENSVQQIQVEAFFPPNYSKTKPLEAADYTLDISNGKVYDAYATYVNVKNTEIINVNYVPTKIAYGDPTDGRITADEYNMANPSEMSNPIVLKTNFEEVAGDANYIAYTIGTLIDDAIASAPIDGGTVAPVEPLAGNIS